MKLIDREGVFLVFVFGIFMGLLGGMAWFEISDILGDESEYPEIQHAYCEAYSTWEIAEIKKEACLDACRRHGLSNTYVCAEGCRSRY